MMKAVDSINEFVDVMLESRTQFENVKQEIDRRNSALRECAERFKSSVTSIMNRASTSRDAELQKMIDGQKKALAEMLTGVADSIERTRKGMKFIEEHEQSFNIAVFGKVKAGKSYIGNFIMGNIFRDRGLKTSYDKIPRPKVSVYDRGKRSELDKLAEFQEDGAEGFRVDPNEATSAIQLFSLGGMKWFDTPGIGSVTWENEMLAKEYVDNADLIVYMCNSDAAGTQQDFTEMKDLHGKKKRFLLLLTQSDDTEDDVDDDGNIITVLVPKNPKDRTDMEDYICEALKKNGITELDRGSEILTVSAKLALEALKKDDQQLFDASNIHKFLAVLIEITKNDAAKLKLATPSLRINTAITEIISRLKETDAMLTKHMASLDDARERLTERNELVQSRMLNECMSRIEALISEKASAIESRGGSVSAEELEGIISSEVYSVVMKTCAQEFAGSEEILSAYSDKLKIGGVGELKMRTDTITYTRKETYSYERDPDGLFEHIGHFLGKRYYGFRTRSITEHRTVDLGVNLQQVMQGIRSSLEGVFMSEVPEIMRDISSRLIAPVEEVRKNAGTQIAQTIRELEGLKC